ncbi:MAG: hypothetical protein AAF741_19135 [Bacteroidota bacterium]
MRSIYLLFLLSFLFLNFDCEDDFDERLFDLPGTFVFGFGGGDCASDCATIFMLQDSLLFEYGPGLAPNLGPGAHRLSDWVLKDDQSRLADVIALRDAAPEELSFNSRLERYGCPGCTDGPFAQVGVFDESGFGSYSYIDPTPPPSAGVSNDIIEYGESVRVLVEELE